MSETIQAYPPASSGYNWGNEIESGSGALTPSRVAPKGLVSMRDKPTLSPRTTDSIPYGYCHCGCGQRTPVAERSNASKGWIRGEPLRYLRFHANRVHDLEPPNPSGLCKCGCGQKTDIASRSSSKEGWIKGHPKSYINGHNKRSGLSNEERFWSYVDRSEGCWEWSGYRDKDGYGRFSFDSRRDAPQGSHRIAYQLAIGPIPDDLVVMHKCDNPPCCNPAHLELGTHLDNQQDRRRKGR